MTIQQNPNSNSLMNFTQRVVIFAAVVIICILFILFIAETINILLLIFSAVLVAIVFYWLSKKLQQLIKVSHRIALLIVVFVTLSGLIISGIYVAPKIYKQSRELAVKIPSAWYSLQIYMLQYEWGEEFINNVVPDALKQDDTEKQSDSDGVNSNDQISQWIRTIFGVFGSALNILIGLLFVIILAVYIAYEPQTYLDGFLQLIPQNYRNRLQSVFNKSAHILRWWMAGQLISMSVVGILAIIVLTVFSVPLALIIGVVTAFTTLIPIVGATIGLIPALAISLTVSPKTALWVTIFYIIIQNIEGNFLTPVIHRKSISLPPVLILIVQLILLKLIGVFGVILAIPLTATGIVFIKNLYIEDVLNDYPANDSK
jgi:predicted PurR-regulated permease PerM